VEKKQKTPIGVAIVLATKSLLFLIIFTLLTVFLAIPKAVLADGLVIKPDPYSDRWDYLKENNQQAVINYENGLEKMILSVGVENFDNNAIWIFPIPSEPNKVVIDVMTKLLPLSGQEISKKAKSNLLDVKKFLPISQIYTIPIINWWEDIQPANKDELGGSMAGIGSQTAGTNSDIVVHEHLDKEGIITEIITAKTAQSLYQYFQEKNLSIEPESIPVLDHYIGKDFTFIVSWLSEGSEAKLRSEIEEKLTYYLNNSEEPSIVDFDFENQIIAHLHNDLEMRNFFSGRFLTAEEFLEKNPEIREKLVNFLLENPYLITPYNLPAESKQKGVFVTFPTDEIYYPLMLTSAYESLVIPTTIRIVGYVSPKIFNDIKNYTNVEYYIDSNITSSMDDELESFYNGPKKNVKYTKIEINAPAKLLTEDLWITPRAPIKSYYSSFFAQHPWASG